MTNTKINPASLYDSLGFGFSHAALQERGRTLHLAGQVAWDKNAATVGAGDLAAQTRQALILASFWRRSAPPRRILSASAPMWSITRLTSSASSWAKLPLFTATPLLLPIRLLASQPWHYPISWWRSKQQRFSPTELKLSKPFCWGLSGAM
jgi:hypothetical protein